MADLGISGPEKQWKAGRLAVGLRYHLAVCQRRTTRFKRSPRPFMLRPRLHAKKSAPLAVLAVAALTTAPIAGAQLAAPAAAARPATAAHVIGAYVYIQRIPTASGSHTTRLAPYATVVFKTDHQLPRRFDGSITTGGITVADQSGGSIGSVHGPASRCYEGHAAIGNDNKIQGRTPAGKREQTTARAGSQLRVTITTERHGASVQRTLTLRNARPGDASGKPLGC